jgi:hypothetical protein
MTELSARERVLHRVKEIARYAPARQWCVVCTCGHESYDATKSEAIQWHRDHVDLAKRGIACCGPFAKGGGTI